MLDTASLLSNDAMGYVTYLVGHSRLMESSKAAVMGRITIEWINCCNCPEMQEEKELQKERSVGENIGD